MAEIKAFEALRYTPKAGKIEELVCPPYDIISEDERKEFLKINPYNVIRLELPKEGENPYKQAGETLKNWVEDAILACDSKPGIYIYEEEFSAYGQTKKIKGIICRVKLEDFSKGVVLPHEETLSKAKQDRFNLMEATGCNFSSIYSLYFDEKQEIYPEIENLSKNEADITFKSGDRITHRMWCIYDTEKTNKIANTFADKKLYIADGHHRYTTALNYRDALISKGENITEGHSANYCMMTLVNMENSGLVVFPTHRIVRDMPQFDTDKLLEGSKKYFEVSESSKEKIEAEINELAKQNEKAFGVYDGKRTWLLKLTDKDIMKELMPNASDAYRQLDVTILHSLILEKLLGIDKENMANQKNLTYIRETFKTFEAVDKGEANCGFIINATRVDEIAAVAGAGEKMPQKSTYFYPKIITGHVMNKIL